MVKKTSRKGRTGLVNLVNNKKKRGKEERKNSHGEQAEVLGTGVGGGSSPLGAKKKFDRG